MAARLFCVSRCRCQSRDGVHAFILALRYALPFCLTKGSAAPRDWTNKLVTLRPIFEVTLKLESQKQRFSYLHLLQGLTPGADCYTALQRDQRQAERIQRINEEDKARRAATKGKHRQAKAAA